MTTQPNPEGLDQQLPPAYEVVLSENPPGRWHFTVKKQGEVLYQSAAAQHKPEGYATDYGARNAGVAAAKRLNAGRPVHHKRQPGPGGAASVATDTLDGQLRHFLALYEKAKADRDDAERRFAEADDAVKRYEAAAKAIEALIDGGEVAP